MGQVQSVRARSVLTFCSTCFLLFGSLARGGEAPEVEWMEALPSTVYPQSDSLLQETSDAGFVVLGNKLMKTDARGSVLWERNFDGETNFPGWTQPFSVRQTRHGDYIVGGIIGNNPSSVLLLKVDPQGAILWTNLFGGGTGVWGLGIEATTDGGYVVAASKDSSAYVFKTDWEGLLFWEAIQDDLPGPARTIQETADGGFIVAGSGTHVAFLFKLDGQGNRLWEKPIGEAGLRVVGIPYAVRVAQDGGYFLVGTISAGRGGYLQRLDEEGNVLWRKGFRGPADFCWLWSMDLTSDGGAVAAGFVYVPGPAYRGEVDVYLVRVNQAGELLWEKRILTPEHDEGICVVQTRDGGYAVCTRTRSDNGWYHASLIKLAPERPFPGPFLRRGDVDGNGLVQVTDPVALIGRLFLGESPLVCEDAADTDDDGKLSTTDVVVLLGRLFLGGEPLPSPGSERCGEDPTADGLSCRSSGFCARG